MKKYIYVMVCITMVLQAGQSGTVEHKVFQLTKEQKAQAKIDWEKRHIEITAGKENVSFPDVSDEMMNHEGFESVKVAFSDINFDGYTDIGVPVGIGYGGVNVFADWYLYSPRNHSYEKVLSEVLNLEADKKEKVLISEMKSGQGVFHEWYRINRDGKPYLIIKASTSPGKEEFETTYKAKGVCIKVPKSHFYDFLNGKKLKSYLVRGDKVEIVDIASADNGKLWVEVEYQGKKKRYIHWMRLQNLSFVALPMHAEEEE